jgi:hypothetical protein
MLIICMSVTSDLRCLLHIFYFEVTMQFQGKVKILFWKLIYFCDAYMICLICGICSCCLHTYGI